MRLGGAAVRVGALAHEFLDKYHGSSVHFRGMMVLGLASAVLDVIKRYEAAGG